MSKIGILAGGGKLPLYIGNSLIQYKYRVIYFCIEPYANILDYKEFEVVSIKIESLSKIINTLK